MARSSPVTTLELTNAPPLWDHQVATKAFLKKRKRAFDFSAPGTGKTRAHIEDYADRPKPKGRLLVIAPKTLMDVAWAEDIQKYAPQLTVSLAYAENREEAFQMKTDVVVMNHDAVKWLDDKKNVKYLAQFDHLVLDEGNAYKNPKSQRSKAMVRLRKYFEWRRLLTGTPNPNSVMELWNPAMIVDDGKRLGNSYFKLRSSVQSPTQVGPSANMIRWDDKPGATQAVNELIGDITIRHAFEDVMTHVPPNHRHTKTFKLSPKTRKIYDKLETEFVAEFDNKDYVDAVHAAALRTKLLQIASGAVYTSTDEDSGYTLVDTTRYDLIADLVEERDHCVVFFNWRHQRDYLVKAFAARDISCAVIDGSVSKDARIQIVKDYQAGKYKVILLHPRTGAHGLTLTMGTTTIFSSPIYEADLMEQGIARIVRGMHDKVTYTIFIEAEGTVEAGVYKRLNDKAFNMNDLLNLMRHRKQR